MSAPESRAGAVPSAMHALAGKVPETPEGAALVLLHLIIEADRSLTSRTANQPVAAYILDLYAQCLEAASGDRRRHEEGAMH